MRRRKLAATTPMSELGQNQLGSERANVFRCVQRPIAGLAILAGRFHGPRGSFLAAFCSPQIPVTSAACAR
jgi:hypothetical protein